MKSTGIVRKVDELGRIVLPSELRRTMGIEERDSLEIFIDNDKIILKKYQPSCVFLDTMDDLYDYKGKKISKKAVMELAKLVGIIGGK